LIIFILLAFVLIKITLRQTVIWMQNGRAHQMVSQPARMTVVSTGF
jgi:hypothetical protein